MEAARDRPRSAGASRQYGKFTPGAPSTKKTPVMDSKVTEDHVALGR